MSDSGTPTPPVPAPERTEQGRVRIFDTTLRDGEQSPGISLNRQEKLEIAHQLARLGVDIIEAGFPITSPGDFEAVQAIAREVEGPVVCGLARTSKQDIDAAWNAVKDSERPRIHTFIATSDSSGECDCSFRAGPAGFIRVLDDHTIAYPEYRGNGVMASLGNMLQNPHVGIFLADFTHDLIGLHVNGDADILTPARMREFDFDIPESGHSGRQPVQWVLVHVTEAYIHCSKHIPKMIPQSRVRHWGTDNPRHKGSDYFGTAASKAATARSDPLPREEEEQQHSAPRPDHAMASAIPHAARGQGPGG